jgi:2-iminobutanoate/2-iminopropanoate deaminase
MEKHILDTPTIKKSSALKPFDPIEVPFSQAIKAKGEFLFISGQTAVNEKGEVEGKGDVAAQTRLSLKNVETIVKAAGGDMRNIVQTMWFVKSIDDFYKSGASTIRREFFKNEQPTSTLVEIKRLADPEFLVEVQAIAIL